LTLQITLIGLDQADQSVSGIVVDPAGRPVEGARVALGNATTRTGTGGAFAFDLRAVAAERVASEPAEEPTRLCAIQPGFLPAVLERAKSDAWPKPLILRLGGEPLVIDGRVVDADGKPVAHAEVWTSDETQFGYIELEGGEMSVRFGANVEGILRGDPHARRLRTDAAGSFALTGLMDHEYRVHVLDVKHLRATTATFAAGTRNIEIRLPKEPTHEHVAGRVTSLSGEPIAGVQVVLLRRSAGAEGLELDRMESSPHTTDAEGRFTFDDIARAMTSIQVRGEGLALSGSERAIAPQDDVQHLELSVPMTVHVQVETDKSAGFDKLQVLDQDGKALEAGIYHGNSAYAMRDIPLKEGRTEVFTVSETGKTLVLYAKGTEMLRKPLKLVRGDVNAIKL
jgi:protocatechuate 3,4-dioxygenase beta subunit